jgi:hypothetical protein
MVQDLGFRTFWKHLSNLIFVITNNCSIVMSSFVFTSSNCLPFNVFLSLVNRKSHTEPHKMSREEPVVSLVEYYLIFSYKFLHKLGQVGRCTVMVNLPLIRVPFLWPYHQIFD